MELICIDIGNSTAHWAGFDGQRVVARGDWARTDLIDAFSRSDQFDRSTPVSWCSVVPSAGASFAAHLAETGRTGWRLTCETVRGLRIDYPQPAQIGQDRLANAVGAQELAGAPAIVIDMGTATTFDLVTAGSGYIGGVIAPGLSAMTDYLAEKTALLPRLDAGDLRRGPRFGRSTPEAMAVGCTRGYPGMIRALLAGVREEFAARGEGEPAVLLTGGAARGFLRESLAEFRAEPDLTLIGLATAWRRFRHPVD